MSLGCYLEVINRSFSKIIVTADIADKKQWENPDSGNPASALKNRTIDYYSSDDMEMNNVVIGTTKGYFSIQFNIVDENNEKSPLYYCDLLPNLNEGREKPVRRNYIPVFVISKDNKKITTNDVVVLVSRGRELRRIKAPEIDYGSSKGIYKIEIFRGSEMRFGVMADIHLGSGTTTSKRDLRDDFTNSILKLQNRPRFIAICGDITNNCRKFEPDELTYIKKFTAQLEQQNIPVAEGVGNHDNLTFFNHANVLSFIKERNKDREKDNGKGNILDNFSYDSKGKNVKDPSELHYRWSMPLYLEDKKLNIHFFQVNNVPGTDNRKDGEGDYKYEAYSYSALNYLA
ncbi:MAG: metallophosphoesterase [Tannerella sp.]|jgi:hypothetical protein|nr:metallophosphoesterase [Tannerella sp.]